MEKSAAINYRERVKGEFGAAGGVDGDDGGGGAFVVLSHLVEELRGWG